MLDKALADSNWTAIPGEQGGSHKDKPPAVILDVDETVLDNSKFQAWMVMNDTFFNPKGLGRFRQFRGFDADSGVACIHQIR